MCEILYYSHACSEEVVKKKHISVLQADKVVAFTGIEDTMNLKFRHS